MLQQMRQRNLLGPFEASRSFSLFPEPETPTGSINPPKTTYVRSTYTNTSSFVMIFFRLAIDPSQRKAKKVRKDVTQAAWLRLQIRVRCYKIPDFGVMIPIPTDSTCKIPVLHSSPSPSIQVENTAPNNGIEMPHSSITESSSKS